jgi:hypothetical protein
MGTSTNDLHFLPQSNLEYLEWKNGILTLKRFALEGSFVIER